MSVPRIYLVTFADRHFRKAQSINTHTARSVGGFEGIFAWGPDDLDASFRHHNRALLRHRRGAGYWIWKPHLVLAAMRQIPSDSFVFYCDAGAYFVDSVQQLVPALEASDQQIMPFSVGLAEREWTKRDLFAALDCDTPHFHDSHQRVGGYFLVQNTRSARDFIHGWYELMRNTPSLVDDSPSRLPNLAGFRAHRHDQSCFSLLSKQAGLESFRAPDGPGDPERPGNSPYPRLLFNPRRRDVSALRRAIQLMDPAVWRRHLVATRSVARSAPQIAAGQLARLAHAHPSVSDAAYWLSPTTRQPQTPEPSFHIGANPAKSGVMVLYNSAWGETPGFAGSDLPAGWALTSDRGHLAEADAVVFHLPSLLETPRLAKPPGQLWVAWSMESSSNLPQGIDAAFLAQCDLQMTHRRSADVFAPYFGPDLLPALRQPAPPKSPGRFAVYMASNPRAHTGRSRYVLELMRHIDVHSYGSCLNNRRLQRDEGRDTRLPLLSTYCFTLAFENTVEEDYVTEKFFDPLIAGSVPVYLGAPNIRRLAPGHRSFIDVRDFPTPRALAYHLRDVAADEVAYAEYLAWKDQPLRPAFTALVKAASGEAFGRLAALVSSRRACDNAQMKTTRSRGRTPRG